MKISVFFFAFASVWHSVHGQEQSTFLRGRGAEVEAAVEDEGASFGNMVNSHKHVEEDREDIITETVGGAPVDPQEYKVPTGSPTPPSSPSMVLAHMGNSTINLPTGSPTAPSSASTTSAIKGQKSCYTRWYTFDRGISGDWDLQTTQARQNTIDSVWAMHSKGTGADNWSRMRYAKYTFNNHPAATTRIKVTVRGAPDGGKNSNAYLIQTKGRYDLNAAIQDGSKDEIDFFEYYGGSNKDTMNVFRRGRTVANYPQVFNVYNAGNQQYTYELILKKQQKYLLVMVFDSTGKMVDRKELWGDSVPTEPMDLFIGIWDCSMYPGFCPGKVDFDTWMGVKSVYIEAC
jgi:hypothetical protein